MSLRKNDLACRYGGEEFVIILPEANKDETYMIAERLRSNIQTNKFLSGEFNVTATVSLGIATFPSDAKDKSSLIACADSACLKSKKAGKNKTSIFPA
jgi:diguanylate cyclase (GGDEF)-like protein